MDEQSKCLVVKVGKVWEGDEKVWRGKKEEKH